MNIFLTVLIFGVCGSLIVCILFLLKYLCDISYSLRRLYRNYDYYMHKITSRTFHIHIDGSELDQEDE